ncbi:TPA_asm: hypothetical protein G1X41_22225 [Salmonella enterica subsp. enterica serovar Typhimurium str. SL1344]|uniref:Conjugative transfer protein n=1 Tax=Salmonella typhimurium (strain SL1344) TaxID=216597 RepID=A0A719DMV5_SALTS|nr:hypothetical protein [Salmonella enterica subsp. enterica serovar Typhimurium str. SL1344]
MRGINMKGIHNFMNISRVVIGLINETLRCFPLGLVMIFVGLFYFVPDGVLGDIIHEWQETDASGKIYIIRLWLMSTFVYVFASVLLKYLCSDAFMPKKCINKNNHETNKQSGE